MGKSQMSLGTAAPTANYFFDSWGRLYAPCPPDHPGALAFGPAGTARRAQPEEAGLFVNDGRSPWAAAMDENRVVVDADGWNWLTRRACSFFESQDWLRGGRAPEWDEDLIAIVPQSGTERGDKWLR